MEQWPLRDGDERNQHFMYDSWFGKFAYELTRVVYRPHKVNNSESTPPVKCVSYNILSCTQAECDAATSADEHRRGIARERHVSGSA